MSPAYAALEARFKRLFDLEGALALLSWDQSVMMPKGASGVRAEQMATLTRIAHDMLTAPETADLLAEAGDAAGPAGLDGWQRANLREMARQHKRATAVDPAVVEALVRATAACEMTWRTARPANDFKMLLPRLREVLDLVREQAAMVGAALGLDRRDALLDEHQPGLSAAEVDRLMGPLAQALPPLIEAAIARQEPPLLPVGPFPIERQRALGRKLVQRLGFDFEHGRMDESTHPFCGGIPDDVRMTTRYDEREAVSALLGILHETGHALYSAGLPRAWRHQPVGQQRGMAVHESQSLLIEMQVCRSPEFVGWLAGELRDAFGPDPAFTPENLARLYRRVERGLIRVDADEVTYPLHIILRYRLEKALIEGDLDMADLPLAWNEGMAELVGVTPPDDRLGCLQDIHWPIGAFGYFPGYTLGALLAAQLFQAAEKALPGLRPAMARAELGSLVGWLRSHVHEQGSHLSWTELIIAATGAPLSTAPYLAHLRHRYLGQ
jgi:carboxypeptidase Taq